MDYVETIPIIAAESFRHLLSTDTVENDELYIRWDKAIAEEYDPISRAKVVGLMGKTAFTAWTTRRI